MIATYLIVCLFINLSNSTPELVSWVNSVFDSNVSGTVIFWVGLMVVMILDAIID